jgi:hypothetical protein
MTRLYRFQAALTMLSLSLTAAAEPLIQDMPRLQQRVAALVAGSYPAPSCSEIPDRMGRGAQRGQLRVSPEGQIVLGTQQMPLFGAGTDTEIEFSLGRSRDGGFHLEIVEGQRRHAVLMPAGSGPGIGSLEIGETGGARGTVSLGWRCADLDLRRMPLLAPANPLADLMAEIFDTGGVTVVGNCRSGSRPGRTASYLLRRDALLLNGRTLPFKSPQGPLARVDFGSRMADGSVYGRFEWADGQTFQVEQMFGAALELYSFRFREGAGQAEWVCERRP